MIFVWYPVNGYLGNEVVVIWEAHAEYKHICSKPPLYKDELPDYVLIGNRESEVFESKEAFSNYISTLKLKVIFYDDT